MTPETVIAAFDDFAERDDETEFKHTGKPCFIPLDNASIHRSQAFRDKQEDWLLRGICPRFIPPYCPELNLIEILWRKVKYEWLPMQAYQSTFEHLKTTVKNVLDQVGQKLWITFA
ncbi:MAG: transposase [Thiothrix sp.]|nr:transposase [Thiothrix sp.]